MENRINAEAAVTSDEYIFYEQVSDEKRKLYGIAFGYLRNETDALEALQEATCRAWTNRKSLKDPAKFHPWLTRILINCCNDELKRRKRAATVRPVQIEDGVMEMRSDRKLDMEQALDGVKDKYRQVLILKYYRDMTLTEIAEILDKPEGTIKTWLNKGLKQLRVKMNRKGGLYHA